MEAKVYVGTYAKYNSGSIFGKWLDLEDYSDKDEFLEACAELHSDEEDPEFMYQDYEGFPEHFYSESGIDENLWEYLELTKNLSEDEIEALHIYVENFGGDYCEDSFRDHWHGQYNTEIDFTYEYIDSTGMLSEMPENLQSYFDYQSFSNDLFLDGYSFIEGHVFSTY